MPILGGSYFQPGTGAQAPAYAVAAPMVEPQQSPIGHRASAGVHVGAQAGRDQSRHGGVGSALRLLLVPVLDVADMALRRACPTVPISVADATAGYMAGTVDDRLWRCIVSIHGGDLDQHLLAREGLRRRPEVIESAVLRNRELLSDTQYDGALRQLGFTQPNERQLVSQLRFEVPGPSDLVRFAVRHVFEPELISEFGYDDEYRPILDAYHHAQGVDYPIFSGPLQQVVAYTEAANNLPPGSFLQRYMDAGLSEPTWARAYWWSHWILPSPTQGYEMMFRLDPTRDKTGEPDWMQSQDFDLAHLRLLLRANDYPPYWRDKLAAIAYRPPNLRFLRVQLQTRTITHAQAVSQLRQMGFRPDYAEAQASALERQLAEQRAEKVWGQVRKGIREQWELGLITDDEARANLTESGIDTELVEAQLFQWAAEHNYDIGRSLVKELHRAYLTGVFTWPQTVTFLTQVGIVPKRQAEYQRIWGAELQARRKEVTASQAQKYAVEGVMDIPTLVVRLRNLNYSDAAIELILRDTRYQLVQRDARTASAAVAAERKTQRELANAVRAQRTALAELRSQLGRHGTPAKLKTWYCAGLIGVSEVTQRLSLLGWPQPDIDRLLEECDAKRIKAGLPTYTQETGRSEKTD